jgi:hypothetical protein
LKKGGTLPVCSLTLTDTTEEQLGSLGGNAVKLENSMAKRAFAANANQPGIYDASITHLRAGFDENLREQGVRKERIMGHRIYFVGNHADCNYTAFFIKLNKKGDDEKQDDNNPQFHEVLKRALAGEVARVIPDPNAPVQAEEEKPDWQKADWYKQYSGYTKIGE